MAHRRLGEFIVGASITAALAIWAFRPSPFSERRIAPPAESNAAAWYVDVTDEVGLDFVHDPGPVGEYFMPQIMGSGAAVLDFDCDGRLDIYLLQNAGPESHSTNRLYHQEVDGRFTDVSRESGLDVAGYGMGVAVGDVNNDSWPDVVVTEYGKIRLFLNLHDGKFIDKTQEAGLDNLQWGTSASFFDYDRDGWLDLVVVNYLDYDRSRRCYDESGKQDFCGPRMFSGAVTRLYHNRGKTERGAMVAAFDDVTVDAGLGSLKAPGLGVYCTDFNGDRWPDIFVASDAAPNYLWINQRDGTFREEATARGLAFNGKGMPVGNMGVAIGDVDGDGLFDVFVTHLSDELHALWRQSPAGYFEDRTSGLGLGRSDWNTTGFGTVMVDADLDGDLDLIVAAGAVRRPLRSRRAASDPGRFWEQFTERSQLFINDGQGRYHDASAQNAAVCGVPAVARGLAYGDFDGDGTLDLLVTRIGTSPRLCRGTNSTGHWLIVKAIDPELGGRDAYGAEISVEAGNRCWKGLINPASSYLCSSDPRAHFGLGDSHRCQAIRVVWPDGCEEAFDGQAVDRVVVLSRGSGTMMSR